MKKLLTILAALCMALCASAKEIEKITVLVNQSETITAPFPVKSFAPSNKQVARVELLGGASLRVSGLSVGRCDLDVFGDNGLVQKYEVTIAPGLTETLETLTMDLDSVPEVKAEIRGNFIRLDGEVSNIQKWEYLVKVIANYGSVVKNFAKFYPGPEILLRLKDTLEQAGFTVQFKPFGRDQKTWPYETVALDLNKKTRVLNVQSRLLNVERRISILSILKAEQWLAVNIDDDWKKPVEVSDDKRPYVISTLLSLPVDKPVIRLSVAYMAIGEKDIRAFGDANNEGFVLNGVFQTIQGLLHGQGNHGNVATLSLGLDGVIKLMAENGINRMSEKGYTMFENWDEKGASFKSGGSVYVRIVSRDVAEMREIPYGFEVKTKGGLVTPESVALDMDISVSSIQKYDTGEDIDKKEDKTQQKVRCPLGRTTLLSGFGELVDDQALRGFPVLRHTPLISWFVGEDGKNLSDRRLVIMVCPEVVDPSQDGTLNVDNEISIPVQQEGAKSTDQRIEERKPFSGFWYWLNWFTF